MDWQEYEEAVARMYEQAEGLGEIRRNVFFPDRVSGEPRQIDVALVIEAKGHEILVIVDAKFRKEKLDVKDIEGVLALADAVGANKSIVVAANGWTRPAELKARFVGLDLVLLDVESALDLMVEDKWELCPGCERDCIVLEFTGALILSGLYAVVLAGQCRECRLGWVWCWDCGVHLHVPVGTEQCCACDHAWRVAKEGVFVRPENGADEIRLEGCLVEPEAAASSAQLDLPGTHLGMDDDGDQ